MPPLRHGSRSARALSMPRPVRLPGGHHAFWTSYADELSQSESVRVAMSECICTQGGYDQITRVDPACEIHGSPRREPAPSLGPCICTEGGYDQITRVN